jgi:hypothetical protein
MSRATLHDREAIRLRDFVALQPLLQIERVKAMDGASHKIARDPCNVGIVRCERSPFAMCCFGAVLHREDQAGQNRIGFGKVAALRLDYFLQNFGDSRDLR